MGASGSSPVAAAAEENGRTWIGWFCLLFFFCSLFVLFCSVHNEEEPAQRRRVVKHHS
jgi:hypothetical protein